MFPYLSKTHEADLVLWWIHALRSVLLDLLIASRAGVLFHASFSAFTNRGEVYVSRHAEPINFEVLKTNQLLWLSFSNERF